MSVTRGGGPTTVQPRTPAAPTQGPAPTTTPADTAPAQSTSQTAQAQAPAPQSPAATPTAASRQDAQVAFSRDVGAAQRLQQTQGTAAADAPAGQNVGGAGAARPAASTFTTREAGVQALQRDFGVRVRDGNPAFSAEELSRCHESFSRMSTTDRAALQGVDLRREHQASAAAAAETGQSPANLAGLYSPNVTANSPSGTRANPPSITLYDSAFPSGAAGRQSSIHTVLHEAGHAVEGRARDDAMAAHNGAVERHNATVAPFNNATTANNTSIDAYNTASRATRLPRGATTQQRTQFQAFQRAENAVGRANQALGSATTPAQVQAAQTRLQTAVTARDTAFGAMGADHPSRSAAQDLVTASNNWGTTAQARADAAVPNTAARTEETAARRTLDGLQNSHQTSSELQSFQRFRGTRPTERPISAYGGTGVGEDYAEAYALYRRDPTYMQQNYPRTHQWFQQHHP